MTKLREILAYSEQYLKDAGIARSKFSAEEIIAYILKTKRMDLYLDLDKLIDQDLQYQIKELLMKRAQKVPFAYLSKAVHFFGCTISVNSNVLIPRPETEVMVDLIAKRLSEIDIKGKILWDICTGSGCIAISLKKKFPKLTVIASDLSLQALEVAKENANRNQVQIEFRHGDFLEPFEKQRCDFLVSNPPYVSAAEYLSLSEEVKDHEPELALLGGDSGLEMYRSFSEIGSNFLLPKGQIFFEIGSAQGEGVKEIFSLFPNKTREEILKDYSGHDRFFFLEIE